MAYRIFGIALAATALAGGAAGPAARQSGAHEHGVGQLNISIEAAAAHLELTAPGADIVGFEHPPASAGDRAAVTAARDVLAEGDNLFIFPAAAGCALVSADIDGPAASDDDDDHDHDDDKHKGDHANKAEHADHDEHKHKGGHADQQEHADHDDHDGDHSTFRTVYSFACSGGIAPASLTVRYFERFPSARLLRVQAISPNGQSAATLTPDAPELKFQPE